MLDISKYYKLIVGCSAIATASIGGFFQSADATQISNHDVHPSTTHTTLIANGVGVPYNGSNNGGANGSNNGGFNGSNNSGKGRGEYYQKGKYSYYYDSNNGGAPEGKSKYYYYGYKRGQLGYYAYEGNNGEIGDKGVAYSYVEGKGFYNISVDGNGTFVDTIVNGSDGSGGGKGGPNNSGSGGPNRGANVVLASRGTAISKGISIAQGKYDAALSALAAAEAATPNTSSKTSPVRYGREVADASACGCPNADTADAGSLGKDLIAAKAAEAEAAAELASVKAEARKFLESVKAGESGGSGTSQPIW